MNNTHSTETILQAIEEQCQIIEKQNAIIENLIKECTELATVLNESFPVGKEAKDCQQVNTPKIEREVAK